MNSEVRITGAVEIIGELQMQSGVRVDAVSLKFAVSDRKALPTVPANE